MKRRLIFTALTGVMLFLVSCATILNSKQTTLKIITDKPTGLVVGNDTVKNTSTNRAITVNRNKTDLKLIVFNDSLNRTLNIHSFNSAAYWANLGVYYGLGMLIDRTNPKRYGYPPMVYVNLEDDKNEYQTFIPINSVHDRYWNIIKFTPLKLIGLSNPSVEASYERRTTQSFSTQVMASYLLPLITGYSDNRQNRELNGFRVALEERFYFKNSAPFGPYIAIELDYLNSKFKEYGRHASSVGNPDFLAITKENYSGNFKLGYQIISNKISFDFFVGLGLRYKNVNHFGAGNPNNDEITRFFNFFYDANREGKYTVFSLPMNLRTGYTF